MCLQPETTADCNEHVFLLCRSYACPRPAFVSLREDQLSEPWPDHLQRGWLGNRNHLCHPCLCQRTGGNISLSWYTYGAILRRCVLSGWTVVVGKKLWFTNGLLASIIKLMLRCYYNGFWHHVLFIISVDILELISRRAKKLYSQNYIQMKFWQIWWWTYILILLSAWSQITVFWKIWSLINCQNVSTRLRGYISMCDRR